ncbi:MAG: hypothetical protein AAFV53_10795 [Myxococcota bacterium]
MAQTIAGGIVALFALYTLTGLVFSVPFALRGVERVDPSAADTGWGFRLLITPGVIAFWPLLLRRWMAGAHAPTEHNAHRAAAEETS